MGGAGDGVPVGEEGDMAQRWNGVWEKVLSIMLTVNVAVMGWLWSALWRLADRMDAHLADRAIHREINAADLVGRPEFEAVRQGGLDAGKNLAERIIRLEEKVDRAAVWRGKDAN